MILIIASLTNSNSKTFTRTWLYACTWEVWSPQINRLGYTPPRSFRVSVSIRIMKTNIFWIFFSEFSSGTACWTLTSYWSPATSCEIYWQVASSAFVPRVARALRTPRWRVHLQWRRLRHNHRDPFLNINKSFGCLTIWRMCQRRVLVATVSTKVYLTPSA